MIHAMGGAIIFGLCIYFVLTLIPEVGGAILYARYKKKTDIQNNL